MKLFILIMAIFCLCGCKSSGTADLERIPEILQETEETKENKMQRVGTPEFGYINIPQWWVLFKDVAGGTDLQYTNGMGSIITMNVFEDQSQEQDLDAKNAAGSIWSYLQDQAEVEHVEGAVTEAGGYEAYQVWAYYKDQTILVVWAFEAKENQVQYLSAEGSLEEVIELEMYIAESFSFEP